MQHHQQQQQQQQHHPAVYIHLEDKLDDYMITKHQQQFINGGVAAAEKDDVVDVTDLQLDEDHHNLTNSSEVKSSVKLYSQLRQFYNEGNFSEIMFLLPQISQLNIIPPIFHLIIGCTMVHFGRLSSAFREVGVGICLAPNEVERKEFIKVLAFIYADLNDKDSAMGCLGEILDISRGSLLGTKEFDEMKVEICQLEKNILAKLEQAKLNKQPITGKIKSFDDQVLDLIALHKTFPKDSFTRKCQAIIGKINQADIVLQKWDKERAPLLKYNPLKLLVEAILVLGPSISYYGMLKLEPIMNQYFEYIENSARSNKPPKTRVVSAFFLGGLTPVSRNGSTISVNDPGSPATSSVNFTSTIQQMKIIKGFIAMLRHKYKEAYDLFHEAQDEESDYYNHVLLLKYICQSNEPHLHRRDLEVLGDKIIKLPFVSTFKFHTLAKIYQRLYLLQHLNSSRYRRKSILKSSETLSYRDLSMKYFLSAAAFAQDDDLYITQYYDNILNFLIGAHDFNDKGDEYINKVHMPTLAFFYQVRNNFCLRSDYNYLHIPNLVGDWQETKNNTKLKLKLEEILDPDTDEHSTVSPVQASASHKSSTKSFDMVGFWEREYLKFKGELPDIIKSYLHKK
ncbi:hypothetical protein I9W82_003563 [Candida metapsilosis]|uniref:Uncharacterized protein n=1 Tax=Candida metapsilosis TaxID=273372 RepID=A0A8H7ZG40_9ASCO|nr:hypothetical protein I9W82_003563 [Candida metapsilosis]